MKRILLLTIVSGIVVLGFAQRASLTPEQRNYAVKRIKPITETMNFNNQVITTDKQALLTPVENSIMELNRYDLQTNSSMQNRIFVYDDGTIGAAFTFGLAEAAFADRGTGYNYFDGTAWGSYPTARIESDRTGWPAYAAWGENGEINCSHYSGAAVGGLNISKRSDKGTGTWEESVFHSPEPLAEYLWPRMTTGGADHSVVHVIGLTMPVANGGVVYQGLDGALLYSRSTDGGATWDPQHLLMEELSSSYYNSFSGDTYEIQAQGDNVAILYGESWQDLAIMKSTDGGSTWTQTIIWQHPYPFYVTGQVTDTFYCADGAHALAFDQSGMVHVVFGINRAYSDAAGSYWFPLVEGLGYWNETRPTFSSDMDALCPYSDCSYSELVENYSLIGWAQDINENGTWDILGEVGAYYIGASSQPQIVVDDMNGIYVVWAAITETYNNGIQDYRHLWGRYSPNGDWWGDKFVDLTSDLIHIFDECVFPSVASNSTDEDFWLVYQTDIEPGLAVRGDLDPYTDNTIRVMTVPKIDLKVGINENTMPVYDYDVLQNYPNPASGATTVKVNIREASEVALSVVNMMGQQVLEVAPRTMLKGMNEITFDVSDLASGTYFYTVKAGNATVSKKMLVE